MDLRWYPVAYISRISTATFFHNEQTYHNKLLLGLFYIDLHVFYIVVNPIQHRALIYDHHLKVLEDIRKLNDTLRYLVDLTFPLGNGRVVAAEAFLGRLL